MAEPHTLTFNWSRNSATLSKSVEVNGSGEANLIDESVLAASPDTLVNWTMDVSALLSLYIVCDKNVTIKTNNSGSPVDEFTLLANKPLVWYSDGGLPNPFASGTDVTKLYITVASGTGVLNIRAKFDATP